MLQLEPEPAARAAPSAECGVTYSHHRPVRLSGAKRACELDMAHCPSCGGELEIIAAVPAQPLIEKTLTHPGLQALVPPRAHPVGPNCKRQALLQGGLGRKNVRLNFLSSTRQRNSWG